LSFIQAIVELVEPIVNANSKDEYVLYRDKTKCWRCIQLNKDEGISDEINCVDPLAVKFEVPHLIHSSFAVHEFFLTARLHRGLQQNSQGDSHEAVSIVYFMDSYVGKLSHDDIEFVANHEVPIQLLSDSIPVSLKLEGYAFNQELAPKAFEALVEKINLARGV